MQEPTGTPATLLGFMAALVSLVVSPAAAGEWEDEFPVVLDPVPQYLSFVAVAPDDVVYVLWPDWTVWEDTKVILTSSPDKGQTWTTPAIIFEGTAFDNFDLAADETGLHLLLVDFYEDDEGEFQRLYYTKSVDGGDTFSTPVRVGTRNNVGPVKLLTSSGKLLAYARDYTSEFGENYLYVSTDGGSTWEEKPILPGLTVQNPGFVVRDGVIHMAFGGFLVQPEIQYSRSADDGDTWSAPVAVSSGAGSHSQLPQIAVDEEAIHVAWEDDRSGHFNVVYSRSADGGLTWSHDLRINRTYYGARTKLLADEEGLHVVWCQYHGTGWPSSWGSADYGILWYKFSDDAGLTWTTEFRVSQNEDIPPLELPDRGANYVKLAEYRHGFCALWQDKRDGNIDVYMRNNLGLPCPGDTDGDRDTDLADLAALLAAYGTSLGNPGFNPEADFDGSGSIDLSDLAFLLADYGCGL